MKNIKINELLKGTCIIALYYLLSTIYAIPFTFFLTENNTGIINLLFTLSLTITFCIIYHKTLINDFKDLKNNYKQNIKIGIKYWIRGIFIMYASSYLLSLFNIGITQNEEANRTFLQSFPIIELVSAVILAPLIEELVFRRSLKNFTTNIYLYSITTGIIFGFIHIVTSLSNPLSLLYIIPYSAVGISLGFSYYKTNNIYTSMFIHSLHNFITIIALILVGGIIWKKKLEKINSKHYPTQL